MILALRVLALASALAACSYEEVLPQKEVASDAANVIDVSFSELDTNTAPLPDTTDTADTRALDSAVPGETQTAPDADTSAADSGPGSLDDDSVAHTPDTPDGSPSGDVASDDDTAHDAAPDVDTTPARCGGDLFLSEYVEGTGWNKALEIANFTGRDVDLQGYALWKITNGGDWAEGAARAFRLSGVLTHGHVLVVCHANAAAPILAACDVATTVDAAEFNGDDALALVRNGAIIDVIGSDGGDPGVGWSVGGVDQATADHTLRRKVDVVEGSDTWAATEPTWTVLNNDVVGGPGGLGALLVDARCEVTAPPRAGFNEIAAAGIAGQGQDFVEIAAFAGSGQQGALSIGGWVIASTSGRYTFPPGATVPVGGFRGVSQGVLGFALGLIDRVWLYDAEGALQDVVGWQSDDLASGASYGRLPDLAGDFVSNTIATPGAGNRNPDTWCGDATCQDDEDCAACPDDCRVCHPGPGDLVVSEVMADPANGPEWFEVVNATALPLELSEVVVRDEGLDFHLVAPAAGLIIEAGDILVMASGPMTGVAHQYEFTGASLAAANDEIILERLGVIIDAVTWTAATGRGIAWSLSGAAVDSIDNDLAGAWCPAVDAWDDGQRGTPGSPNPTCAACGDATCDPGETCDGCPEDCGACPAEGCAADLFISQYVEGTSYNKAIELANRTGVAVDLTHYALWRITNGGSSWAELAASSKVSLVGMLANGEVWVGCNTSSDAALTSACDALYGQGSAPTNFNGDDAVALAKDGVIIDVIGVDALDPGIGWAVGGVADATANHTLVRKSLVRNGNVDWATSALDEWEVRVEDDFFGIGAHDVDYTCQP